MYFSNIVYDKFLAFFPNIDHFNAVSLVLAICEIFINSAVAYCVFTFILSLILWIIDKKWHNRGQIACKYLLIFRFWFIRWRSKYKVFKTDRVSFSDAKNFTSTYWCLTLFIFIAYFESSSYESISLWVFYYNNKNIGKHLLDQNLANINSQWCRLNFIFRWRLNFYLQKHNNF